MMMDPELKQKWIDALRSGKYQQARSQLRSGEGFCCLGVLCDITNTEISAVGSECIENGKIVGYEPIRKMLGISHDGSDAPMRYLWNLNDDKKWSFEQIADYIEGNL